MIDINIIVVRDGLEKYLDYFDGQKKRNNINLLFTDLAGVSNIFKSIETGVRKEQLLMIIRKELAAGDNLDLIVEAFTKYTSFYQPFFLYMTDQPISDDEICIITQGDNYYYYLPCSDEHTNCIRNFNSFLSIIKSKLITLERITHYIVDSFENIIDKEIIKAQKNQIEKLNHEITEMSKIDFLTNLFNRRAFFEALEAEKKRTIRDHWRLTSLSEEDMETIEKIKEEQKTKPNGKFLEHFGRFSCMLIDIDFFKKINDTYGHLIGDQVLKEMGKMLKSKDIFRENDIPGRFGGEEFIVILPETSSANARIPAERLRESIKKLDFFDEQNKVFHISISIGISEFNSDDKTNEDLINRADQALYYAKQRGRDQVIIYEEMV